MTTKYPRSILLIGLGELGTAVLDGLLEFKTKHQIDIELSVLVRSTPTQTTNPKKRAQLDYYADLGVSYDTGDISQDDTDTLAQVFSKYEVVIGCSGMAVPSGTQLKIARAVLSARVPLYIPWQFGVDYDKIGHGSGQDLFDEQLDVRDLLREQSDISWIIVSTGMFMSFLFEPFFDVVDPKQKLVKGLGNDDNSVTVTAVEDIGVSVVEIVLNSELRNHVVFIAGDTISYRSLTDVLNYEGQTEYRFQPRSVADLQKDLQNDPNDGMKKYRLVFAAGIGVAWEKSTSFNFNRHLELQTVQGWLQTHGKQVGLS